jgi:hypothetical protein
MKQFAIFDGVFGSDEVSKYLSQSSNFNLRAGSARVRFLTAARA